jgi:putative membrane protein
MNCLAPLAILATRTIFHARLRENSSRWITAADGGQIATLWAWHLPPALEWAMDSSVGAVLMSISLGVAALWFWSIVIDCATDTVGRALLSLLVTGKLFCLLGVLLTFAPRPLYGIAASPHAAHAVDRLADQQLAGLLMLVFCPLTYVLAAIVITARWLTKIHDRPGWQAKGAS